MHQHHKKEAETPMTQDIECKWGRLQWMGKAHQEEAKKLLARCLDIGISNLPAIDVVELVVRELETDPLFNSGHGSALTEKNDGNGQYYGRAKEDMRCRFQLKHPFAKKQGVELVDNEYFITEKNVGMLKLAKEVNSILFDYRIPTTDTCGAGAAVMDNPLQMNGLPISVYALETVGCVVVDKEGSYVAATSTGGLMNKMTGKIREAIIRSTLAREVAAVMEYKGLSLNEALDFVIKNRL
ncbi:putative isoaspartyl peptidase/L-asparaginase 2 [Hibiscus syriacus]|uniref:Isoaspartyl peptidase/L-asparaginase 2 n=1 Tax=Hibiscus syriacus TaxID=106335 RepID=A0A6A3AQB6_HIBSY|nr:putative isoaspartyl peptidase/L-asparaginase 2 [Hibiscus syriacus]